MSSSYNVNYGQAYAPPGSGLGWQQSHAFASFQSVPAVQQMNQHYGAQPQMMPAPVPVEPQSMPYSSYINHMNTQIYDQQTFAMQQMQRQMAAMAAEHQRMQAGGAMYQQEPQQIAAAPTAPPAPPPQDEVAKSDTLKAEIKKMFVDELMRRLSVSGTFEITEGTVKPFGNYPADDPVADFYRKERSQDLADKPWDPEADCEYLRKAMKGLGTDEDAIIHVVATRCNAQRQRLKEMFKTMYGRDLITDIKSELSGDFREAVMACFVQPAIYDAWSVKEAIYGLGTDEQALIEIFMTRTNAQIREMKEVYTDVASPNRKASKSLLEDDIRGDTSGNFKKLLVAASQGGRYEITRERLEQAVEEVIANDKPTGMFDINYQKLVDMQKAKNDANRLFKAGEERWGTDEETFNLIFSTRDYYSLREIWTEYVKIAQRDILNSIDRETSGDYKRALRGIVMNIRCRPMYFAERLRDAMKGLGTDDKTLIRIIISRAEIDMVQIKKCFLELTKQTLWRWIKNDTSGDYKKLLQALVGKD
uniref:Annexin n=1 Tax=Macrostomum lignano TaxID=282301 RepID=A0A1I8HSY7_9PLAT